MNPMRGMVLMAVVAVAMAGCGKDPVTAPGPAPVGTVYSATGDIVATVEEFRTALGPSNGGTPGEQPAGRREISWDGAVANPFNNRDDFPADFFNTTVRSGAIFATPGTGFRNDSTRFREINATYAAEFNFFSPTRIFSPIGSNQFDQLFRVAGEPTPAVVRGFGIVFSDVDLVVGTTIQLFDRDGASLGTYTAPVRSDGAGQSFIGVTFADPIIARARITLGTGALGAAVNDISTGSAVDLVVCDNLIYGEPRPAPSRSRGVIGPA